MRLTKKKYDSSYYQTIDEKRPFQATEIRNKTLFIKTFQQSGTLLELGCGKSGLLQALRKSFHVCGVDISSYCVETTNELFGNKVAELCNLDHEFPNGSYDVIIAFEVLEHLNDPLETMHAAYLRLHPGGIFIFSVPNNYGLVGKIATRYFNLVDRTHINTWERKEWIQAMKECSAQNQTWDQIVYAFSNNRFAKFISFDFVGVMFK